jgi:MFS family permease
MINALGATNLTQTLMCFAIICLTSPTLGILIGSSIINYQGGYESKNSILICLISSTLSAICTIPAPFTTNIYTFTLCLWLVLFFGGAIVPPLNGIIMSSIPRELVGTANSIVIMISNLFGYLPAPFLYGIIKDMYGQKQESEKNQERYTMRISLWLSGLGVVFLLIATIIRYKKYDEIYMDKNINEAFTGRRDLRTSTRSSQNRTYIIQYMNGIVSGIEDDCEIISNEDIIKMTEDNNKEKHFQGINYDANNVQSGLNLENSTFKLMKDDDDI